MQTQISSQFQHSESGKLADKILRNCVHCGFCNATCPTYQLSGNELDGPRGRIYQIKQLLEGQQATLKTKKHLDQCLQCLNCETTCPSGVQYHQLLEIGKKIVEKNLKKSWFEQFKRSALLKILPYPVRFNRLYKVTLLFKPFLPAALSAKILSGKGKTIKPIRSDRKVLLLHGCVQDSIAPAIQSQSINLLNQLAIETVLEIKPNCCGAINYHMNDTDKALDFVKANLDSWSNFLDQGIEAIVSNASGCGAMIKEYPGIIENHLGTESNYYSKALRINAVIKDIGEFCAAEDLSGLKIKADFKKIAYHPPCTLQHGQRLPELVENLLNKQGVHLTEIRDKHLCCGSAGTYSLFHPEISEQLRENKLKNLQADEPDIIATANIGCLHHLQEKSQRPVIHWVELFE